MPQKDVQDIIKACSKKAQGKCVAEVQPDESWLIMFPDGTVASAKTKLKADKLCKAWFKKNLGPKEIGIGIIEWRS